MEKLQVWFSALLSCILHECAVSNGPGSAGDKSLERRYRNM
jgi:hypothetical protein